MPDLTPERGPKAQVETLENGDRIVEAIDARKLLGYNRFDNAREKLRQTSAITDPGLIARVGSILADNILAPQVEIVKPDILPSKLEPKYQDVLDYLFKLPEIRIPGVGTEEFTTLLKFIQQSSIKQFVDICGEMLILLPTQPDISAEDDEIDQVSLKIEVLKFFIIKILEEQAVCIDLEKLEAKWDRDHPEYSKKAKKWLDKRLMVATQEQELFSLPPKVKSIDDIGKWFKKNGLKNDTREQLLKDRFLAVQEQKKIDNYETLATIFGKNNVGDIKIVEIANLPFCRAFYLGSDDYEKLIPNGGTGQYTGAKPPIILMKIEKSGVPRINEVLFHEYQHAINDMLRPAKTSILVKNNTDTSDDETILGFEGEEIERAADELLAFLPIFPPQQAKSILSSPNGNYDYRAESVGLGGDDKLRDIEGYNKKLDIIAAALEQGLESIENIYPDKMEIEQIQICISLFRDTNRENWASLAKLLTDRAEMKSYFSIIYNFLKSLKF